MAADIMDGFIKFKWASYRAGVSRHRECPHVNGFAIEETFSGSTPAKISLLSLSCFHFAGSSMVGNAPLDAMAYMTSSSVRATAIVLTCYTSSTVGFNERRTDLEARTGSSHRLLTKVFVLGLALFHS